MKQLPKTLYRYLNWENEYAQKVLTEQELYFARASCFNDPFDCKIPVRYNDYELRNKELVLKKVNSALEPELGPLERAAAVKAGIERLRDKKHQDEASAEYYRKSDKEYGVLCFTIKPTNLLMWAHYANKHRGIVVGFNSKRLVEELQCSSFEVEYASRFPTIPLFRYNEGIYNNRDYFQMMHGTKSLEWSYEKEWRLFQRVSDSHRAFNFSKSCITHIIIGCAAIQTTKDEVSRLASSFNAILSQANRHADRFEIELTKVQNQPVPKRLKL